MRAIAWAVVATVSALGAMAVAGPGAPPEKILAVIAGSFPTGDDAARAGSEMGFGDVQGFYVARSGDFEGEPEGRWLLVTAFRTRAGALAFEELARAAGVTGLRTVLTTYRGEAPIGLGQESHPAGTGPLLGPLPAGHPLKL